MKESQAIAILNAGRSYAEAAEITGLTIEQVINAWKSR